MNLYSFFKFTVCETVCIVCVYILFFIFIIFLLYNMPVFLKSSCFIQQDKDCPLCVCECVCGRKSISIILWSTTQHLSYMKPTRNSLWTGQSQDLPWRHFCVHCAQSNLGRLQGFVVSSSPWDDSQTQFTAQLGLFTLVWDRKSCFDGFSCCYRSQTNSGLSCVGGMRILVL